MSNFFLADRIKELSRVEGTINISLDGAVNGFSSFADFYASGDVVFYAITDNIQYEIGSGIYEKDGSNRVITRNVLRSSNLNVGPYYVNGTSNTGVTDGQNGYFHPLWLSKSAAISGVGVPDGPFTALSGISFDEFPGQTFYYITEHFGAAEPSHGGLSGVDFNVSGQPVNFTAGVKEVFVTYPGKTAVLTANGLDSDIEEPQRSGIAFWRNEQILDYSSAIVFDKDNGYLGVGQIAPEYAVDVAGGLDNTGGIRASGFITGGSGVYFSGGALTDVTLTASGGQQYEPFRRNRIGTAAEGVIELSGVVDQIIGFAEQSPGTVFMGPVDDWCGTPPCDPDYPTFRALVDSDLPDLSSYYVVQNNNGLDIESKNTPTTPYVAGMIAMYHSSGEITYDSGIFYDATNNRLSVGGDASVDSPSYTIDVAGDSTLFVASGYTTHLLFPFGGQDIIRIGAAKGNISSLIQEPTNQVIVAIGKQAGEGSYALEDTVAIGTAAGAELNASSGVVAIGTAAVTESHEVINTSVLGFNSAFQASGLTYSIGMGESVLYRCSGVSYSTLIGSSAGYDAEILSELNAIGYQAASGARDLIKTDGVGDHVFINAVNSDCSIGFGYYTLGDASGLTNVVAIGCAVASGSQVIDNSVFFGENAMQRASGVEESIAIGTNVGVYSSGTYESIMMGRGAGLSGIENAQMVAIGVSGGLASSGSYNIFVGANAGASLSGNENIEIIASGSDVSFLGTEASGRINIGNTIVGDIYNARVGLGAVENASPSGTVYVRPSNADEAAFIIRHQGSGSQEPYVALQSGDATTFYHVTNSGDVITSGCMNPSGGLLLESINPTDWMNTTTNRLYNDGGTLKFNGNALAVGGGFTSFNLSNNNTNLDAITDGQNVTVSGISGVEVVQDTVNNVLQVTAYELSGTLQEQITAQTYSFFTTASGTGGKSGFSREIASQEHLGISGVSGVLVDLISLDDGVNSSGVFRLGIDASFTYTFDFDNGAGSPDTILDGQSLTISGVSGVVAEYNAGDNTMTISASGLSGVINQNHDEFTETVSNEFGLVSSSGISGVAYWASGEFERVGAGSPGTSGVALQDNRYILDWEGSGNLKRLNVEDNLNVFIGVSGGHDTDQFGSGVAIGAEVDVRSSGSFDGVRLGRNAGYELWFSKNSVGIGAESLRHGSGNINAVAVGENAGRELLDSDNLVALGHDASLQASGAVNSVTIGYQANSGATLNNNSVILGSEAGWSSNRNSQLIGIGSQASYALADSQDSIIVGTFAGTYASGINNSVVMGRDACTRSADFTNSVCLGTDSSHESSGIRNAVSIGNMSCWRASGDATEPDGIGQFVSLGFNAGSSGINIDRCVFIGAYAGSGANSTETSVFIGANAGMRREGANSFIVSIESDPPDPSTYDADWSDQDDTGVIDIATAIQGQVTLNAGSPNETKLHIGRELDSVGGTMDGGDITSSALNITPPSETNHALKLFLNPDTAQSAGMVMSEYRDAGDSNNPGVFQTVINNYGFLSVPIADGFIGGVASNIDLTVGGTTIEKVEGAIVGWQINNNEGVAIVFDEGGTLRWKQAQMSDFDALILGIPEE